MCHYSSSRSNTVRRARLPSLYSDFTSQRSSNPDGYSANVNAWSQVLFEAARAGVLPTDGAGGNGVLSLTFGQPLLLSLNTREWGQPLALGTVIVLPTFFWTFYHNSSNFSRTKQYPVTS